MFRLYRYVNLLFFRNIRKKVGNALPVLCLYESHLPTYNMPFDYFYAFVDQELNTFGIGSSSTIYEIKMRAINSTNSFPSNAASEEASILLPFKRSLILPKAFSTTSFARYIRRTSTGQELNLTITALKFKSLTQNYQTEEVDTRNSKNK